MAWPSAVHTVAGEASVRLLLPPDLDTSEVIKYPLLLQL
jgi:hypothetical protein